MIITFIKIKCNQPLFLKFLDHCRINLILLFFGATYVMAQSPGVSCGTASVLTQDGPCGTGTVSDAVLEPGINNSNICSSLQSIAREGWYQFQATSSNVSITANSGNRNLTLQAFSGSCGSLNEIGCNNSTTTIGPDIETMDLFGLIIGNWYYIRVGNVTSNNMTLSSLCITTLIPALNDDPCNAIPISVGTSCSYTTFTNVNSTQSSGMVQPGCGSVNGSYNNDVWFSVVVPPSGTITVQATDGPGAGTMFPSIAFYSDSCNTLMHSGCALSTTVLVPATGTYVGSPGSTVWIRVWDYNEMEDQFNLCAFTNTNTPGDILPDQINTVICGGPALTFSDPGGMGNYSVNSSATYTICPNDTSQYVTVNFSSFNLENGLDYLTVINGSYPDAPIIGNYTGNTLPPTITSSANDGCLKFAFNSDMINAFPGWLATITCSATPGTNVPFCSATNCSGNCGIWFCAGGLFPTTNSGSVGVQEFNEEIAGCLGGTGEVATAWFYFTASTAGSLGIQFNGPNGQNYDFAIWGPGATGIPPCPLNTGDSPIRCSYADVSNTGNPVGLIDGAGDMYEGLEGNGWVEDLDVLAGETYAMALNIYMSGNPQPVIDLSLVGTAQLDCIAPLPINLQLFDGLYDQGYNRIRWISETESNNHYYTLLYSGDGINYSILTTNPGVGNSNIPVPYAYSHISPYAITYYKLQQTDYDGRSRQFGPISVSSMSDGKAVEIILFPNPASGSLNVYSGYDGNLQIDLNDHLGKIWLSESISGAGIHPLDIHGISPGIYYLRITSATGTERIEKLMIE